MRRAEKTYDLFSPPRTDMFGTRSAPSPLGGFVRGMSLVSDNARYTVCSARCVGRLWVMALERVMFEGDGNA